MKKLRKLVPLTITLVLLMVSTMIGPKVGLAYDANVNLGTADSYAVLAGSAITNTGATVIDGDVGLHPGTSFTGQAEAVINGEVHLTDAVAQQAKVDLLAAYNDVAGRPINTINAELGGATLIPGVYSSAADFGITGTLTLDGQNDPDSVFIFQAGSSLTTASSSKVRLINGADYNNVFWQVSSSATLGTNSEFAGNILSFQSITATTGADIQGRLLALNGAVTLDNNTIEKALSSTLTVRKVVTGDISDITLPTFEITVTGPEGFLATKSFVNNESYTWENLVPGEYSVTENRTGLSSQWTVSGEGILNVSADQAHLSTITNLYTPTNGTTPGDSTTYGSLTVQKVATGDISNLTLPAFQITVTGPENFTSTRSFANNEVYTWENLLLGEYHITENRTGLSSRWSVSGEGAVLIAANQQHLATITNLYTASTGGSSDYSSSYGSLTVKKIATGDIDNLSLPTFEITVTGPGNYSSTRIFENNESYTWSNLLPGEYFIMESRTGLSSRWTVSGEGPVQVLADQQRMSTIINIYDSTSGISSEDSVTHGSLTVSKKVIGDVGAMDLPVFEITVTGPDNFSETRWIGSNASYTWENLLPGTYTITENRTGLSSQWTVSGEGTVEVEVGQERKLTITNEFDSIEINGPVPQTGQKDYSMAIFMAITAVLFAGFGFYLKRSRKKI